MHVQDASVTSGHDLLVRKELKKINLGFHEFRHWHWGFSQAQNISFFYFIIGVDSQ
jgi:hypothetical protein